MLTEAGKRKLLVGATTPEEDAEIEARASVAAVERVVEETAYLLTDCLRNNSERERVFARLRERFCFDCGREKTGPCTCMRDD